MGATGSVAVITGSMRIAAPSIDGELATALQVKENGGVIGAADRYTFAQSR